jgi:hypothetical protein
MKLLLVEMLSEVHYHPKRPHFSAQDEVRFSEYIAGSPNGILANEPVFLYRPDVPFLRVSHPWR